MVSAVRGVGSSSRSGKLWVWFWFSKGSSCELPFFCVGAEDVVVAKKSSGFEPICLAMVLCDYAHHDLQTSRYTLLAITRIFRARSFPSDMPPMHVYVALTDGRGDQLMVIRLADVDEEEEPLVEVAIP